MFQILIANWFAEHPAEMIDEQHPMQIGLCEYAASSTWQDNPDKSCFTTFSLAAEMPSHPYFLLHFADGFLLVGKFQFFLCSPG